MDFVIPPFAADAKQTRLTLLVDGVLRSSCCYGIGEHQAAFRLPATNDGPRRARVILISSSRFVPAQRGLNEDRRVLAVLLKRVLTVTSSTGDMYLDGTPVSANLLLPRWRVVLDAIGLAIAGLSLLLLVRKQPKYAWIAILVSAPFLLPVPIYGTTISLEKVVIILSAVMMFSRRRYWTAALVGPGRWIVGALLLFVADMALSGSVAAFHAAALREMMKFAEYALASAVAYGAFLMGRDENALQGTLCWIICAVSVLAFAQPLVEPVQRTLVDGQVIPRLAGPLEGPNQFSAFLGITLIVTASLARRFSFGLGVSFVLGGMALILTLSRGGIVAFFAGLIFSLALIKWPLRKRATIFSGLALGVAVLATTAWAALAFPNMALDRVFGGADAYNGGLGSRAALWHTALVLWRPHPILGIGPGNYELLVGSILPGVRTHPNGYFFQVLAEQGVFGLALFLVLILTIGSVLARYLPSRQAAAGLGVLVAMMFHQLIDGLFPYPKVTIEFWALIAILVAAAHLKVRADCDGNSSV